ncbi:MAG: hypothetical protein ACI4QF_08770 [Kiritimatiellia bacterium]
MTVTNPIVANALVANTGRAVCNFFGTLPGDWPGLKSLLWANLTNPSEYDPLLFKSNLERNREKLQHYAPKNIGGTLGNLARKLIDRAERGGIERDLLGKKYHYLPMNDPMVQELKRAVQSMAATQDPAKVRIGTRDEKRSREREFDAGMRALEKRNPYWRD